MQYGVFHDGISESVCVCYRYIFCVTVNIGQFWTNDKNAVAYSSNIFSYNSGGQAAAIIKGIFANARDRLGDGDGGQAAAIIKSFATNTRDRLGDDDGG